MRNIFKYIPMVTLGQILGTVVAFPLLCFLINIFYYSNKYNDDAEQYSTEYMNNSYDIEVTMPEEKSKLYIENVDKDVITSETFREKIDNNYFSNPRGLYFPFYSVEYKKYFSIMCFLGANRMHWPYGMKVILTVNRDDMNNPAYGTKENPVPVLKDVGVDESIRDNDQDYDKAYMDSFYRENVIRYLKYKMPKSEFKRRFKKGE
ncbi:hypothetical protein [Prevotella sp.]|uniref:hypothetical protein n=1 Tax=Prevotella sp. TaxID=59823 RepID=UPI001CB37106|nr:hypothetical protein [Prevotella sp.]MBF1622208.1 hypothetical protein [Prevotella sp.]MBF1623870.1 hypothetical protein [Prevotella sp.]